MRYIMWGFLLAFARCVSAEFHENPENPVLTPNSTCAACENDLCAPNSVQGTEHPGARPERARQADKSAVGRLPWRPRRLFLVGRSSRCEMNSLAEPRSSVSAAPRGIAAFHGGNAASPGTPRARCDALSAPSAVSEHLAASAPDGRRVADASCESPRPSMASAQGAHRRPLRTPLASSREGGRGVQLSIRLERWTTPPLRGGG